jgi:predicted RNA-binding Zn-ribbon protein involved in translation (DUF1610 family)
MNTTDKQKEELLRRSKLSDNEIHYGYNCPECGELMNNLDNYVVDGVLYPIITNEGYAYDSQYWTEDHMCPNCKIPISYSDGT